MNWWHTCHPLPCVWGGDMKKTTRRRYAKDPSAIYRLMSKVQPFTPAEQATLSIPPRIAYEAMRTGRGGKDDFDTLAAVINVAMVCSEPISQELVDLCQQAQNQLLLIRDRFRRTGKWGLDHQDMRALPPVLDLHEQYLQHCTPMEMANAMREVLRRCKTGDVLKPKESA